jgi:T3SS negative regulator,GrlR
LVGTTLSREVGGVHDEKSRWRVGAIFADKLWGEGFVILRNGRLLGCDPFYFFEGTFEVSDNGKNVKASVQVERYAGPATSIFFGAGGPEVVKYTVEFEGAYAEGALRLIGTMNWNPDLKLTAHLVRIIPEPYEPDQLA